MASDEQTLHPAVVAAMQLDRESLNQRFKFAAQQKRIDPSAFFEHLVERVNPVVAAVHATLPERTRVVTSELYDVSLDLFAASILGAEAELPILDRLWRKLLPRIPHLVARDPHRVSGSLCNALLQIHRQTPPGAENWLQKIQMLAPSCLSPQQLLEAGQVLSWTCGMAQYRTAALQVARQLDHALLFQIFEVPDASAPAEMTRWLDDWERNPWRASSVSPSHDNNPVSQVATVGAFRGFGGAFLTPPTVLLESGQLFVEDVDSVWQLFADRFGNYLHRVGDSNGGQRNSKAASHEAVGIAIDGTISWRGQSLKFPHLAEATSSAFDGVTLAVTIPSSFHVLLLAER